MARGNKKAQSILEYVIVLAAVVAIIIYAAGKWIKGGVGATMDNAAKAIEKGADKIAPVATKAPGG